MATPSTTDLEKLKAQIEDISQQLQKISQKVVTSTEDQTSDLLDQTSRKVKDTWEVTRQQAQETTDKIQGYVKENPWQVAGIAAAVGFLIAALVPRDEK